MKKYIVEVIHNQGSTGSVIITAKNQTHAETLADGIDAGDVHTLNPIDGTLTVESVRPATDDEVRADDQARESELAKDNTQKVMRKIVVEVLGGVAEVTQCPDDCEVEIIDHDNQEERSQQTETRMKTKPAPGTHPIRGARQRQGDADSLH